MKSKDVNMTIQRLMVRIARLWNILYYILYPSKKKLVVNAWMSLYGNRIAHNNWGDELNYYLIKELSGKKIFNYEQLCLGPFKPKINYCCIGSIIESHANNHSIIWGSGCMYGNDFNLKEKPLQVHAVRGPLTKSYLLKRGIKCPELFGDPALLLPLIYKPKKTNKKIGIIPHYKDKHNQHIKRLLQNENTILIDLQNYDNWHDIIDQINCCHFIISSSLHGLIVSDTYNIPNIWIELSTLYGGRFKFYDYYASVGKKCEGPILMNESLSINDLLEYKDKWEKITFSREDLLAACPFEIKRSIDK